MLSDAAPPTARVQLQEGSQIQNHWQLLAVPGPENPWREVLDGIIQLLKTHPLYDPVRDDRRFADLLRRVGLE